VDVTQGNIKKKGLSKSSQTMGTSSYDKKEKSGAVPAEDRGVSERRHGVGINEAKVRTSGDHYAASPDFSTPTG